MIALLLSVATGLGVTEQFVLSVLELLAEGLLLVFLGAVLVARHLFPKLQRSHAVFAARSGLQPPRAASRMVQPG
jgi:uncharacterized membrane protein